MTRVIVVDDKEHWLARLVEITTEAGAEVVGQTTSGEEALLLLGTLQPDLIITDYVMWPVDGFMIAKAAKVPAIVVSSGMRAIWRETLERLGERVTALDKRNRAGITRAIQQVLED